MVGVGSPGEAETVLIDKALEETGNNRTRAACGRRERAGRGGRGADRRAL